MSPKQQSERRREIEQEAVNKIISQEYAIFRHDEALRSKTVPELVAALRALKTRLKAKLKAEKHLDWVESTEVLIDMKIEEVIALGEGKPAPKSDGKFWLPKIFKRNVKPEPNDP